MPENDSQAGPLNDLRHRLQDLSPAKRALLEKWLREQATSSASTPIPRLPADAPKVLSFAEQRLWFVDQLEPDHPFYNLPLAARLRGKLDRDAFARSLRDVIDRHETLRSTYHLDGDQPRREVASQWIWEPQFVDLRELAGDETQLHRRLRVEARRPFVLERGPLFRCTVFELADDDYLVLLTMHHIVSDGWSMGVMLRELAAFYAAHSRNEPCRLPPLPIQYSDFAAWQQTRLDAATLEKELDYWRDTLRDAPVLIDLPTSYPRAATQDFEGAIVRLSLSADLSRSIQTYAKQTQVTPFMVLLSAYGALLSRYARQQTVCVGTAVANRLRPEFESLIGFFVNTLVLPVEAPRQESFAALVRRVHELATSAFAHQEIPFEKLVEQLAPDRDRSHSPLFQVAFVLQNTPRDLSSAGGISLEPVAVDNGTAKSDLTLFLWENERGEFTGHIEYRTSLFHDRAIRRMIAGFLALLDAAMREPSTPVGQLPIMDAAQRHELIVERNRHQFDFGDPEVLHETFAEQVKHRPEQVAIIHHRESLTYAQLDARVEHVAAALQARGVSREVPVMVALPRSSDQIVGALAVMRAGGVYVPVDPDGPPQRLKGMIEDVEPRLMICRESDEHHWKTMLGQTPCARLADLEVAGRSSAFVKPQVEPAQLAYMIFTSGSTGIPKGVLIEHRGIVNFLRAKALALGEFGPEDRVMHAFSPCFDGSIAEIFMTLMFGATLVIVDRETFINPPALTRLLNQERVTVGMFSPTLLATLDPTRFPYLRIVLSAGEALTPELASEWSRDHAMFNGYGPTEVSIGVSVHRVPTPTDHATPLGNKVPIGKAMANMRLYILDEDRQPVPIGVTGEMYIGGVSVGRGYLKRPDLTRDRFLADPFVRDGHARMYRTGDLGRWTDAGVAEFMGRGDDQIKLRGFRIELGEIETAVNALPGVHRSAVLAWGEASESRRLVAYVVPDHQADAAIADARRLESEQVASWKTLFDQSHRTAGPKLDREFDVAGWVSTYTGRPLPQAEMRLWVEATGRRIRELHKRRILEIGCGTGLILFQVAPTCDRYVGTDLLRSSLDGIEQALRRHPGLQSKVTLHERLADDFSGFHPGEFDCIVLNSVAQYFPSGEYFGKVLQGAVGLLAPGGSIFLGDLRNWRLHAALATSVERFKAEPDVSSEEFRRRVYSRIEREEELLIDPRVFEDMIGRLPRLKQCRVLLKDFDAQNELSRFRYDVILEFDHASPRKSSSDVIIARSEANPEALLDRVEAIGENELRLVGIVNPRVAQDALASKEVAKGLQFNRFEDWSNHLANSTPEGIDPLALQRAATKRGLEVDLTWNAQSADQYDAILRRSLNDPVIKAIEAVPRDSSLAASPSPSHTESFDSDWNWRRYTNDPLRYRATQRWTSAWRQALHDRLPDYMVPSAFVVVDELPFTVQGKVDKRALPPPPADRPDWAGVFVAPRDPEETLLASIWEDLLEVRPIGIQDSFFELGGHSMLAVRMVAEVEQRSGRPLPLAALFRGPTIEHLAGILRNPEQATLNACLVNLQAYESEANESQTHGDPEPLFCIHPAGGTVFCYLDFARQFAGKRAVYGLQALGVDGAHAPHETLGEMAAHYVRSMREVQPQGPYHVTGWSIGGVIAFEVARQLREQGETVGLLALLDAGLMSQGEPLDEADFLPLMAALFPGDEALSLETLRQMSPEEQLKYFSDRAGQAGIVPEGYDQLGPHIFGVFQANVKAVHEYLPQKYPGPILLVRPREQSKTSEAFDDPTLGWQPYAQSMSTEWVSGDHAHMLQTPAVLEIANVIQSRLSAKN